MSGLSDRDFQAGIAESIKSHSFDKVFYEYILNNSQKILNNDLEYLYEIVYK